MTIRKEEVLELVRQLPDEIDLYLRLYRLERLPRRLHEVFRDRDDRGRGG